MFDPYEYKGCTITVSPDIDPENPRDNDNLGTMICCHGRYDLGDRDIQPTDVDEVLSEFGDDMISLPLYLYDHSGITMNTTGFGCLWDSGQVGRICVSLDTLRKEFVASEYDPPSDELIEEVKQMLLNEVEEYDQYLRGDIYGFAIEYPDGEEDSCYGFYGYEYAQSEAQSQVDFTLDNGE